MSHFSASRNDLIFRVLSTIWIFTAVFSQASYASGVLPQLTLYPVPAEVSSSHFRVSLNGQSTDVLHAATGYYLLNFDTSGPVHVSVTADDPHFWDSGVEVQPMRFGIRPARHGATISFTMAGPSKLTITRPGDHFADAEILFLFANPIDHSGITASTPHVRYYGAGVYHENIDASSGDTIYLAGGAVLFGSLNIWQVENVHVLGTGTIIYDGPQNPYFDTGWIHKKNWHCIIMDNARNIELDGITCITRSRSWQVQMKDSRHIGIYNVKVIGGNPNDANQDGIDWLGGGDTTIRNSFFRASDDVFALQGNWDGYELALMRIPGHDVTNITIEDTIASTSISNTIRVAWPQKTFNSAHFHMSNMDVIHTGYGGCKVPFAFFELWADPEGRGSHSDYRFRDIRLEDWYSLVNIDQPNPSVRDIAFKDMWAMDGPAMVAPILKGDVSGVTLTGATEQGFEGAATDVEGGATSPVIEPARIKAHFTYTAGLLKPKQSVEFTADDPATEGRRFEWLFGDGTRSEGRSVRHRFPDSKGTLLDGSGRFRVLLHVSGGNSEQSQQGWSSQPVVIAQARLAPASVALETLLPGASVFDRILHVPANGGYTFTLLTSLEATMSIDGHSAHSPKARRQVCGSEGDSVQAMRISTALTAGDHHIRIERRVGLENAQMPPGPVSDQPLLLWEGPGIDRQPIPKSFYSTVAP
ncbi:hypothetical protein RBB79_11625 [Tunturiibacter empetritectus]|uniref:PKD domain-containing protein n=1 Tax=Tunturiibacter lichenicola TaxID=2051959 RepID=A0A852VGQ6_9BACT|nr:hypothetical protein [Edaphobacter lichenicola]NYF90229.1 hypothetical protein [Edaphobacter lichenicola]